MENWEFLHWEEKGDSTEPSRGSRERGRGATVEEQGLGRPGRRLVLQCPGKQVQSALGGGGRPNPRAHGAGKAWGCNKASSQVSEKTTMSLAPAPPRPLESWQKNLSRDGACLLSGSRLHADHPEEAGWWWCPSSVM